MAAIVSKPATDAYRDGWDRVFGSKEDEKHRCSGHRVSGHWKGYPCGAIAKYQTPDGRWWCKNHLPYPFK